MTTLGAARAEAANMAEHPNVGRVREAAEAFNRGDLAQLRSYWADDLVWHEGGSSPLVGTYRSAEEFTRHLRQIGEASSATMSLEPLDVPADDSHGVVVFNASAERDGNRIETTVAYAVKLDSDGKQKEAGFSSATSPAGIGSGADEGPLTSRTGAEL